MSCSDTFGKSATMDVDDSGLTFLQDKLRQTSFPMLAPLALDLAVVPASQAYTERVFSVCGNMCTGKHNRMSASLETRVFMRINKTHFGHVLQQI